MTKNQRNKNYYHRHKQRMRDDARTRYHRDPKKAAAYKRKWRKEHPEEYKAYMRKWRLENPEKFKSHLRKCNHGVTEEWYQNKLATQDNKCAICRQPFVKTPHIDHCHVTGKNRDLLCADCNLGLGRFKDNEMFLLSAIQYLRRHNGLVSESRIQKIG